VSIAKYSVFSRKRSKRSQIFICRRFERLQRQWWWSFEVLVRAFFLLLKDWLQRLQRLLLFSLQ